MICYTTSSQLSVQIILRKRHWSNFLTVCGKLPSKEQQLSRTQYFILSSHATMFCLHTQYGSCGILLTLTARGPNYLSTSSLSKKTISMLICFIKCFMKTKNKDKKRKTVINTNKYEQTMSENSQHRVAYYTLVSSFKGPVSLVVWLVDHNDNGRFALVEVNSHVETLNWS